MKKQAAIILVMVFLLEMVMPFSTVIKAAEIVDQGTYGVTISWTLDNEGTLSIKGNELITNNFMKSIEKRIKDKVICMKIEEGVSAIGERMMEDMEFKNFHKLILAGSVRQVGKYAFKSQPIKELILQEGVEYVGESAFENINIETLVLPGSLKEYPEAFYLCRHLKTVTGKDGLKKIDNGAFRSCQVLKDIEIPNSVTELGERAFAECEQFEQFQIPDSVQTIGKDLFQECNCLTSVTVGTSAVNVDKMFIRDCPKLKQVVNHSSIPVYLDTAKKKRTWYVKNNAVKNVPAGETAKAKGKKYRITYHLKGGKLKEKAPKSYRYGNTVKLPKKVKRKGCTFFGWNVRDNELKPGEARNHRLVAQWKVYSVKNIKGHRFKVHAQDADYKKKNYDPEGDYYVVRYSEYKDMRNPEFFWGTEQSGKGNTKKNAGISPELKPGKTYYVEIIHTIDDDPSTAIPRVKNIGNMEIGWLGKRKVKIK